MSDDDSPIRRREVLGSLATVTAAGAFAGVGTTSLLTDEEVFGNAGLGANVLQAGELDHQVCWERPGEDCEPSPGPASIDFGNVEQGDSGAGTIRCSLETNPAWLWFRTSCPENPCGLEDAVEVTLWYDDDCDSEVDEDESVLEVETDGETVAIENMELCKALSLLHDGVLLDADPSTDTEDPFQPDGTCCLGFEWEVVKPICLPEEDRDDLDITFEFFAEQRRHNEETENPFPEEDCGVDCTEPCLEECDFQGISFVAFCIEDEGEEISTGDVRFTPYFDIEGEAFRVEWEADVGIDWVVLFYSSNEGKFFENFKYDDGDGATSGDVWVNSQQNDPDGNPNFYDKLLWPGGQDETGLGQKPSDPCPDLAGTDHGCGVKYEFEDGDDEDDLQDDGVWEPVCGKGGGRP